MSATLQDFETEDTCPNGEPLSFCQGPEMDGLPCWECYREGEQ